MQKHTEKTDRWAEDWIRSPLAMDHMVRVMKGRVWSKRHELFMDKREREGCSAMHFSQLNTLANPGYLGAGRKIDTAVMSHLENNVFQPNLDTAEPRLRQVKDSNAAYIYSYCVLFPETFIHQLQEQGRSREEAESAFTKVELDSGEMEGLTREIRENAAKRSEENGEDSEDLWVDHSDVEDSD